MTFRRQLSWSAAMRDLRRDRVSPSASNAMFAASLQRARARDASRVGQRRLLIADGSYHRAAIMSAAIAEAKLQRSRGCSGRWQQLLASALRFTWSRAKVQRAEGHP